MIWEKLNKHPPPPSIKPQGTNSRIYGILIYEDKKNIKEE